jgi:two-component system sensor histidine kinase TctE
MRRTLQRVIGARSLHRQLLLYLLLPQLVLWLAAAFISYDVAVRYANRAIDEGLELSTRALSRQVKPMGNGLFIDLPRAAQDIIESDPSDRSFYMVSTPPGQFILGNRTLAPPPPDTPTRPGSLSFYDGQVGNVPVRIAALYLAYGDTGNSQQLLLVQLARGRAHRDALVRDILVDTALPLSGLILAMSLIVWVGIRAGLAPLTRLRHLVEGKAPNDLAPIELEAAPPEVRSLAQALNTLLAAVRSNVAAQKRFISDAAHQLRTPLAGLKSQTELALVEAADPGLRSRLQRVHDSATRSAHVVSQLLTLARTEPEAMALQRSRFDLRELARELTAEWVPRALAAGIDLGYDQEDEDGTHREPVALMVDGHPLLLREALANLIDNALRYAGRGTEVTVRARRCSDQLLLEVEDSGPGVPEADRERVLGRFVRGTLEGDGCGLGLAIVSEIVQRQGGRLELLGREPHGLVARITLPAAGQLPIS